MTTFPSPDLPPDTETIYLRCANCGWCYFGAEKDEPALDHCFKCGSWGFEVTDPSEIPRGVTVVGVRWPPIERPPTIQKEQLTAADIMRIKDNQEA